MAMDPITPETASVREAPRPNNLVGLAVVAALLLSAAGLLALPQSRTPFTFTFVLCGWILALMAHEFAHAAVAYLGGDTTVREKGYLAFDPRRYGDLGTSLVLPVLALALGGIGFPGGAVYLRTDLIRSPAWRAAAALAGPGATLAVLLLLCGALGAWSRLALPGALFEAFAMLAFLQATALVLNLLPLPGLDGFGAIRPFLPSAWAPGIQRAEGLTMVALLAALFLVPAVGGLLFGAALAITDHLGAPTSAVRAGWTAFRFWA